MQETERSKWLKQIPQESSEFFPTTSNFTPKGFSITKLSARRIYTLFFETKVITNPWVPSKYIKKGTFKKKVRLALWWKKKKENQITCQQAGVVPESKPLHLPFTLQLHYWGKGSLEGHWPRKFSILLTHHQEGGRRKVFSLGIFLFVCFCFFGSWKGWQRTVIVQAVRIFL